MQTRQIPKLHARAAFVPSTLNEEARTVELTWTTGAQVRRTHWWTETQWVEELSLDSAHVQLDRLNSGAPLLANHNSYSLDNVLGVVERAWIEGNEGRAVVRFSERADVAPILADVKTGILRNISVGYVVHQFEKQKERKDDLPVYRAVNWEPMEISLVTIPADAGAQVRSEGEKFNVTIINHEVNAMTDPVEKEATEQRAAPAPAETVKHETIDASAIAKAERKRIAEIRSYGERYRADEAIINDYIERGIASADVRLEMIDKLADKMDKETEVRGHIDITVDERDKFMRGAEKAMLFRAGVEKDDTQNEFRGMRLSDFARHSLERSGVRTIGMSYDAMAKAVLSRSQGTSDFPVLLENTMHKLLLNSYQTAPDTWRSFCRVGSVSDFRAWKRLRTGSIANLDQVNEHGELTNKVISDAEAESVQAYRYGNIISITPETIINDDFDWIANQTNALGRAAARTIEAAVYAKLIANPTMSDGFALFSTQHGNIQTSGAAISVTTLDAARVAMAQQTDIDGNDYLNIRPAVLLCKTAEGGSARVTVNAVYDPDTANKLQKPNAVNGIVREVVDTPRITAGFYLFADPADAPVLEVVFLDGNQAPRIEQEENFRTKGLSWSVELPFGVGVVDFRGAYFNDGA
jgi:hypothetical protein